MTSSEILNHLDAILSLIRSGDEVLILETLRFLNYTITDTNGLNKLVKPVLDVLVQTLNPKIQKESTKLLLFLLKDESIHQTFRNWARVYSFMVVNSQNFYIVSEIIAALYSSPLARSLDLNRLDEEETDLSFCTMIQMILNERIDSKTRKMAAIALIYAQGRAKPDLLKNRQERWKLNFYIGSVLKFAALNAAWVLGRYLFKYRALRSNPLELFNTIGSEATLSTIIGSGMSSLIILSNWSAYNGMDMILPALSIVGLAQYYLLARNNAHFIFFVPVITFFLFKYILDENPEIK